LRKTYFKIASIFIYLSQIGRFYGEEENGGDNGTRENKFLMVTANC
jgi:hypothetical protein